MRGQQYLQMGSRKTEANEADEELLTDCKANGVQGALARVKSVIVCAPGEITEKMGFGVVYAHKKLICVKNRAFFADFSCINFDVIRKLHTFASSNNKYSS